MKCLKTCFVALAFWLLLPVGIFAASHTKTFTVSGEFTVISRYTDIVIYDNDHIPYLALTVTKPDSGTCIIPKTTFDVQCDDNQIHLFNVTMYFYDGNGVVQSGSLTITDNENSTLWIEHQPPLFDETEYYANTCVLPERAGNWKQCEPDANWSVHFIRAKIRCDVCEDHDVMQLPADGITQATAHLEAPGYGQPPNGVNWSLYGNTLGCTINSATGIITAGYDEGTITVCASYRDGWIGNVTVKQKINVVSGCAGCNNYGQWTINKKNGQMKFSLGKGTKGQSLGYLYWNGLDKDAALSLDSLSCAFESYDMDVIRDVEGKINQIKTPQGIVEADVANGALTVAFNKRQPMNWNANLRRFSPTETMTALKKYTFRRSDNNQRTVMRDVPSAHDVLMLSGASGSGIESYQYEHYKNGNFNEYEYIQNIVDGTTKENVVVVGNINGNEYEEVTSEDTLYDTSGDRTIILESTIGKTDSTHPEKSGVITTSYEYDANLNVSSRTKSDGAWEKYFYDSSKRKEWELRPLGNSGFPEGNTLTSSMLLNCRAVRYEYEANASALRWPNVPRVETEYVQGFEVKKTIKRVTLSGDQTKMTVVAYRCADPYATEPENSTGTLITTETHCVNGDSSLALEKVVHEDGTMTVYSDMTDGLTRTKTVCRGQSNGEKIINGFMSETLTGENGRMLSKKEYTYQDNGTVVRQLIGSEVYGDYDDLDISQKVTYMNGTSRTTPPCCGADDAVEEVTEIDGTIWTQRRDYLKRMVETIHNGVKTSFKYDAAGNMLECTKTEKTPGTGTILVEQNTYDYACRLTSKTDGNGIVKIYSYENISGGGYAVTETVLINGITHKSTYAADGSLMNVVANGATTETSYNEQVGFSEVPYLIKTKTTYGGVDEDDPDFCPVTIENRYDVFGRIIHSHPTGKWRKCWNNSCSPATRQG